MKTTTLAPSLNYADWLVQETQFNPERLQARETVFTLGNGYLGTRGSFEEGYPGGVSTTLIHGVYDDVPIVYTELANCPDWLPLAVIVNGDRFRLDQGDILSYDRHLDLRHGILRRTVRWRSPSGKVVDLSFERFASLADQHVLGLRCQITPVDQETLVEIQSSLNGYPENQGFNHWERIDQGKTDLGIWLHLRTRSSRIDLGMAARTLVSGTEVLLQASNAPGYPTTTATTVVAAGQTITVEKLISVYTSREVENPKQVAQQKLSELSDYTTVIQAHQQAWDKVWHDHDVVIEGDRTAQLAVRYNLFQILISAPRHDDQVSIPAKTLSGFGYRGHVFWDTEIFILPFFTFTQPELARNLLTYRYRNLNGARRKAGYYGYQGAMFPWESADNGDEVTPRWLPPRDPYGEDIRIWCRDREIHISADIAYAIWYYWQATGDDAWMRDCGAEMILDTSIFWASRAEWNEAQSRYEIREVIGADEYHEHVDNNAFTNRMVQWHLEKAVLVYDWLHETFPAAATELDQKLQLSTEWRDRWQHLVQHLWIPTDPETGLVEQFEGFFDLKDINLSDYEPRDRSMQSILGIAEINKWQVLKQPDVLMLLYLMRLSREYPYSPTALRKNWDYYAPRTDITFGSSLGPAIHVILAADLGLATEAYDQFLQAALVDLEDNRNNAHEGIHGASAGGIWQAVVFGFGGVQIHNQQPVAFPQLPSRWTRLKFKLQWQGEWHEFDLRPAKPTEVKGVIFDLDGVLTDTAEYHYRSWQQLADEMNWPFDRQANEALRGVSRRDSLRLIMEHAKAAGKLDRPYTEAEIQDMMERKNRYYVDFIQTVSPADLLPGSLELLEELKQDGIRIALGSASKNARSVIEKLGIASYIEVVADGYSVERSKPAPDLFLYAAEQLGLAPQNCVVVEDSASGIEAAIAAGMKSVGLGPAERVGAADVVLPSLENVQFRDLVKVQ
ncbi:MAG: beta-phosphoglucomutase [Oculatellaceae cyanobacterium Prado106]|jgi:kojibiose phosphorylase|nr:beta-phosphoglucomutase [Oculatellaceae cyanobacterium Prado106]